MAGCNASQFSAYKRKQDNSRFKKGSGVYICAMCGKRTRDTGNGEGQTGLCKKCYDAAEEENYESDYGNEKE